MKIGVIGASHMGVVWSAVLAEKGFNVVYLKSTRFEQYEPGLKELIEKGIESGKLVYDNLYSRLKDCDVVFLAYDTPTDSSNNIQLDLLERVIGAIIPNLSDTAIFVIMSQVPPGFMRSIDFDKSRLFHQVDTLIYGHSVDAALHPYQYIIGCHDPKIGLPENYPTPGLHHDFDTWPENINCVTYEEAEIYKLSMNAMLATQIATTNSLAELCSYYSADWAKIAECLRHDMRIGLYTQPGLGIGGGHLHRDLNTIELLSRKHGFHSGIITSAIYNSKYMSYWAVRQIKKCGNKSPSRIQVLGLSYKQNTDSIKNSAAILTIDEFPNFPIFAHDPFVNYSKVTMIQNPLDGLELANALWILTPHDEYRKIKSKDIVEKMSARTSIIDPYGVLDKEFFKDTSYNYYTIG